MKQLFTGSLAIFRHLYLVSFCEDGDLLSRWRAYGRKSGFSLPFDPRTKDGTKRVRCDVFFRSLVKKVEYDRDAQKRKLRQLAETFIKLANSLPYSPNSQEGKSIRESSS